MIPTESDIPPHGWAPYADIHRERIRAHAKHSASGESIEQLPAAHHIWLAVLTEELGEVANAIIEHGAYAPEVRAELVQVAAVASAWVDAFDRDTHPIPGTIEFDLEHP